MSEQIIQYWSIHNMGTKVWKWMYYILWATNLDHLVQHGIIENKDYLHLSKKKPDNILMGWWKKVFAVVETKIPKTFASVKTQQRAIDQELEVAKVLWAKVYIATDGTKSIWINPQTWNRILDEQGNQILTNWNYQDETIEKLLIKIDDSISDHNDQIKAKELVDPSNLAKSIRQDIRSVSWATPENCLYTFVELFIFKYLSDLGILQSINSFWFVMEMYQTDSPEQVLEYYANNIRKKIKSLFPENIKDKTTIINGTIFVSKDDKAVEWYSTVFKKVLERFDKYGELKYIDHDFKSKLFESFLKESISKKNRWQYFTPLKVVRAMVKMADIKPGMTVGDPACGVGKFLLETVLDNVDKFYEVKNNILDSKINLIWYDKWFDKDEQKTIILAKANMLIYFCDLIKDNPSITPQFAELFNRTFTLKTNSILGTLRDPEPNKYDVILTNPPYVVSGSSNLKEEIKKAWLERDYTISSIGIEWLFTEWIIKWLKPWWQALVVVPDGFLIRQNDKHLRKYLLEQCYLDAIISLPLKTFFTTTKKTYILIITKKYDIQKEIQTDPIFTYLVSEIGETFDIYRFDTDTNHLNDAVSAYNQFKWLSRWQKNLFSKFNIDPRCKLQDISLFDPEKDWSVDRRWSNEEKVALGIQDEKSTATLQEFIELIDETNNVMIEYKDLLKNLSDKSTVWK